MLLLSLFDFACGFAFDRLGGVLGLIQCCFGFVWLLVCWFVSDLRADCFRDLVGG